MLRNYLEKRRHLKTNGRELVSGASHLSSQTVKSFINALQDMQNDQRLLGTAAYKKRLHGRSKLRGSSTIRSFFQNFQKEARERRKNSYQDRARDLAIIKGLSEEQILQLSEFGAKMGAPRPFKHWVYCGARFHLVDILCLQTGVRGDTVRKAGLAGTSLSFSLRRCRSRRRLWLSFASVVSASSVVVSASVMTPAS